MKSTEEIARRLKEKLPACIEGPSIVRKGVIKLSIPREKILELCSYLKEEMGFEHISLISAVDRIERFECVYHITSYQNKCMIQINVPIPKEDARIDSVTKIWGGANYHEREAYDMMGIIFEGHPNLKRILLPKDSDYYPLRKDYKG